MAFYQFNKKLLPLSFNVKNTTFSLSEFDLMNANEKLEKQRLYLLGRQFVSNYTGEIKSFLDYSFSANLSAKYYAELVNRSNVISSFQFDYNLKPVFLTITLNGCFRKALNGDFSTFKAKDKKHLPYLLKRKIANEQAFNARDLIMLLNYQ